ncbi:MAG: hypothetical protein IJ636_08235 [Bacteroidales bacterium]|nr:hypothetical protein [Bacteroidales bacterium]
MKNTGNNSFYRLTTRRFVKDAHKAGKKVRVWTLDGPSRLIPYVDGIITNDPALFMRRPPCRQCTGRVGERSSASVRSAA